MQDVYGAFVGSFGTADILSYLAGNDGASNDILFWK